MPSGGTPSSKDTLETYLDMLSNIYEQVTYDLGSNFYSPLWRNFMDRRGSMVRSVPGDAHWPNVAEKPVELVRTEIAGVWDSFPDLPFRSALKVAACHLNAKYRPIFKSSRLSMHLGVPLKKLPLLEPPLFSLNPIAMPPSLKDLEARMDAMDRQRQRVNSIRARARLATCARAQLTRQRTHPVQTNNGDFFMFWRSSSSENQTGYKGPAICIGSYRELIVGCKGGQLITTHRTRVYLHERAKSPEPLEIPSGLNRPSGYDIGMEAPLTFGEIHGFAGDDENDEMTGAVVPDSPATISTGSSIAIPQGGEVSAISDVEDYVNIPEIAIGAQKGPDFAGSESALEYAPVVYEEPEVNSNITSATPNTSLDLDEQQLIEPSISNDLLELPRAFDIADLPYRIFDRPSGSESESFANNVLEDFTRPPAVVTSSPSPANTDNDFSRPDVSHKLDYSRPDLVSSSSIHPSGVGPISNSNESFALPTTPSILPANINKDFARPEHVSQKRSRSTDGI
jgi:hypothetical protein